MLKFTRHKDPVTQTEWIETELRGKAVLNHPLLNKGTAYSQEERIQLGLLGKLPYGIESLEQQVARARFQYKRYPSVLQKHIYLNNLHDKNEVLFYRLCLDDLEEVLPLIYTPGVGAAVKEFSHEFRQPRGLYISYPDLDRLESILDNRTHPEIDVLVVTDGEGVLGIGDQGIGGMDIPIAKLMVYTLCGLDPYKSLPIMLDVGTDNQELLNHPMYLGWRHPRIKGAEYDHFMDKFVKIIHKKFPHAFLHWEDFGRDNARRILDQYRDYHPSFNDDMQGTGVVTMAAMLSAMKATKIPFSKQKLVIFGAGTAGVGIADQFRDALVRHGIAPNEALKHVWLIDRHGLITEESNGLTNFQKPYARKKEDLEHWTCHQYDLAGVISQVKPTILVGCSTVYGAFKENIIKEMAKHVDHPVIFPLSNPTDNCEAHPLDLLQWTDGKALIATGSPCETLVFQHKTIRVAQCNNALSFPGIGLGMVATKAKKLTDNMLWAASVALSELSPCQNNLEEPLLPVFKDLRKVAVHIAQKVAKQAVEDKVANVSSYDDSLITDLLWEPYYRPIRPKSSLG